MTFASWIAVLLIDGSSASEPLSIVGLISIVFPVSHGGRNQRRGRRGIDEEREEDGGDRQAAPRVGT